jgi:hypothetical protein
MKPEEQTERLAAFPMTNPNPVLEFAADGTMTYCNEAGRRLAASLGAETAASIVPADARAIILECLASGESRLNSAPHHFMVFHSPGRQQDCALLWQRYHRTA